MDFVAIYTLLNTVAGGHYQERFPEPDLHIALCQLASHGAIRESQPVGPGNIWDPQTVFTIADAGRTALLG